MINLIIRSTFQYKVFETLDFAPKTAFYRRTNQVRELIFLIIGRKYSQLQFNSCKLTSAKDMLSLYYYIEYLIYPSTG